MTNTPTMLALNAALCISIMAIALCRLNAMNGMKGETLYRVQAEYVVYMTTAFISLTRPYWGEFVGWPSIMLESAILIGFITSTHAWRRVIAPHCVIDAPPPTAQSDLAPLNQLKEFP